MLRASNGAQTKDQSGNLPTHRDFDPIKDGKTNQINTVVQRHFATRARAHVLITPDPYFP